MTLVVGVSAAEHVEQMVNGLRLVGSQKTWLVGGRFRLRLGRGVTRSAYGMGKWAVKIPRRGCLLRGWLANQSEWKQRRRGDVWPPHYTLFHLVTVYPKVEEVAKSWPVESSEEFPFLQPYNYSGDELKPSSWGRIGNWWLLIDFDRAWQQPRKGLICRLYYWNQERLARKWMALGP